MSPNENLPPIALTPEQAQAMSPATKDAARAMYAPHYPPSEIERVFGAGTPAPQVQQQTVTHIPGTDVSISGAPDDGLSREQRLSLAKMMLANTSNPEAIIAAAEASGITRAELEVAASDPAAVAAQQREAATNDVYSPPATPLEYELSYGSENANAVSPDELQAYDREVRSAFYSGGVPKSLAQGLLTAITQTTASYPEEMSEAARKMRFAEEGHRLKALSNSDGAEVTRLATLAYNALPKDFRETVDEQFGWHSAESQNALAAVGRALEYRKSKGTK
jgi:hypothetical protein